MWRRRRRRWNFPILQIGFNLLEAVQVWEAAREWERAGYPGTNMNFMITNPGMIIIHCNSFSSGGNSCGRTFKQLSLTSRESSLARHGPTVSSTTSPPPAPPPGRISCGFEWVSPSAEGKEWTRWTITCVIILMYSTRCCFKVHRRISGGGGGVQMNNNNIGKEANPILSY